MIYNSIHKITTYGLLKFVESEELQEFHPVQDTIGLDELHYVADSDVDKIVWDSGTYKHRLNSTYSNSALYTPVEDVSTLNSTEIHMMVKQGYSWEDIFGWHVIIKSTKSNVVLFSGIFKQSDFNVTGDKELISGSFWMEEVVFNIPDVDDVISAQITEIGYDDIESTGDSIGYLYEYPGELTPIISEEPIPDYIKLSATIDDNNFLLSKLYTEENKTLKQSILDYLDLEVATVEIYHVIMYGNETLGYTTYRIQNDDNIYGSINVGLNFLPYLQSNETNVEVTVTCEILVNSILLERIISLTYDVEAINPLITEQITHPDTNYIVEISQVTNVENKVIETKESREVVQIYVPVFCELITSTIVYEQKNIYFTAITNSAYLRILATDSDIEQLILSKSTDSAVYFDLSELTPITKDTTYQIIDKSTTNIIGKGLMTVSS